VTSHSEVTASNCFCRRSWSASRFSSSLFSGAPGLLTGFMLQPSKLFFQRFQTPDVDRQACDEAASDAGRETRRAAVRAL